MNPRWFDWFEFLGRRRARLPEFHPISHCSPSCARLPVSEAEFPPASAPVEVFDWTKSQDAFLVDL